MSKQTIKVKDLKAKPYYEADKEIKKLYNKFFELRGHRVGGAGK